MHDTVFGTKRGTRELNKKKYILMNLLYQNYTYFIIRIIIFFVPIFNTVCTLETFSSSQKYDIRNLGNGLPKSSFNFCTLIKFRRGI